MKIVRVMCGADGASTPHDGRFVVAWNPHTEFGTLELTSTSDRRKARRFATASEVLQEWRTVSRIQPKRPRDREPNKPLTGITINIEEEEEEVMSHRTRP